MVARVHKRESKMQSICVATCCSSGLSRTAQLEDQREQALRILPEFKPGQEGRIEEHAEMRIFWIQGWHIFAGETLEDEFDLD